ncbi:pre-mRNA splicing protein [mine drainage metagenome]|uniref:Pre-mRNA splicing protein n=1 Tax=mine drainage metagenome TaxID=410659 RepID=T0Y9U4_9ZZZZ
MQDRQSPEEIRREMIMAAKQGIKSAYSSEEYVLMQAINASIELERSYNLVYERLTEWYGIYFPEIRVDNPKTLATLISGASESVSEADAVVQSIDSEKIEEIVKHEGSMGRRMGEEEFDVIKNYAKLSMEMESFRERLDSYIKSASTRLMPNTTFLTDHIIAAELLSKSRLSRAALFDASRYSTAD